MKAFLLGLVSDVQGRSDEMALLAILGMLTFLGLQIFVVVIRHQHSSRRLLEWDLVRQSVRPPPEWG